MMHGLFSYIELIKRNINCEKRSHLHQTIFFRAPYKYAPENSSLIDYYDSNLLEHHSNLLEHHSNIFVIRIDPEKTYTYSSEYHYPFLLKDY